jgi:hypothetical protein
MWQRWQRLRKLRSRLFCRSFSSCAVASVTRVVRISIASTSVG